MLARPPRLVLRRAGAVALLRRAAQDLVPPLRIPGANGGNAAVPAARCLSANGAGPAAHSQLVTPAALDAELRAGGSAAPLVVDATWFLPNSPFARPDGQGARGTFDEGPRLPGAVFWDADADSDAEFSLAPHNLPLPGPFAARMALMGVAPERSVVAYDQHGVFSSPRLWYTLRAYGHRSVRVLNGGLPAWRDAGLEVETGPPAPLHTGATAKGVGWTFDASMQWSKKQMLDNLSSGLALAVDARSEGRFWGTAPEPREGMRGGHVPGSVSVPFTELLQTSPSGVTTMRPKDELARVLSSRGVPLDGSRPVVASCGSGMTACVVALALAEVGTGPMAVYDGSWAEWGACSDTPVHRRGADGAIEVVP